MDSRGHGRSTRDERPYGYDLMAADVLGPMDFLQLRKATIVGWSDGAILGLDIAINHPERLTKLFAFAANSDPSGVADIAHSPVFNAFIARAETEYRALSPTPGEYKSFFDQISKMWETEPHFTADQLRAIKVSVWIVNADAKTPSLWRAISPMPDCCCSRGSAISRSCRTLSNSPATCYTFCSTSSGSNSDTTPTCIAHNARFDPAWTFGQQYLRIICPNGHLGLAPIKIGSFRIGCQSERDLICADSGLGRCRSARTSHQAHCYGR
jgi:hypothetical protein